MLLLGGEDIGYQSDHSENLAFVYAVSHQPFFFQGIWYHEQHRYTHVVCGVQKLGSTLNSTEVSKSQNSKWPKWEIFFRLLLLLLLLILRKVSAGGGGAHGAHVELRITFRSWSFPFTLNSRFNLLGLSTKHSTFTS